MADNPQVQPLPGLVVGGSADPGAAAGAADPTAAAAHPAAAAAAAAIAVQDVPIYIQPSNPVTAVLRPRDDTADNSSRSGHDRRRLVDTTTRTLQICLPVRVGNFFLFALGRGSFLFFRIADHEIHCRGPEKVTEKKPFFARSFSTKNTSIRAGFILLYAAHRNAEYDRVFAPLKARHIARGINHRENMLLRTFSI